MSELENNQESIQVEYYELPKRDIKISRFFEVAEYLTKNNLWGTVKTKMGCDAENEMRMILDSNLGNAVKAVLFEHLQSQDSSLVADENKDLVISTIKCAHAPVRNPPSEPPPSIPKKEYDKK